MADLGDLDDEERELLAQMREDSTPHDLHVNYEVIEDGTGRAVRGVFKVPADKAKRVIAALFGEADQDVKAARKAPRPDRAPRGGHPLYRRSTRGGQKP